MKIKNLICLIILLSTIFVYSCNKNSVKSLSDIAGLSNATKQAISSVNLKGLKQSYSMLSNEEKQLLWETKLNAILKNDYYRFTADQRQIFNSIKAFASNKIFSKLMKDPKDGETFIKNNLPYFQKHFDNAQLYMLIECPYFCENFSIYESGEYLTTIDTPVVNCFEVEPIDEYGGSNCTCKYSVYCSIIGTNPCVDLNGSCAPVRECGLFSSSTCIGKCKDLI